MQISIADIDVRLKPVLYRVDYNEPIKNGVVLSDWRIRATLPTLDYLLSQQAKIIILSHLGRPGGQFNPNDSLRPVAQHLMSFFDKVQIQVTDGIFGQAVNDALANMKPGSIFFLGNTRFFPEEERNDFNFAKALAQMGELYVTDAFGVMHREAATVTQLPKLMDSYPGLLLHKELETLDRLREYPERPFTALIGGAKLETKVGLIQRLLTRADYILLGGGVANVFAKATGHDIGMSFCDDSQLAVAKDILAKAEGKIILPVDFVNEGRGDKFRYVDIGTKTIALFSQYLNGSRDIFWNGTVGIAEEARFANGTKALADVLAQAKGITTAAGGDTIAFLELNKLIDSYNFVSTGGGSAVAYISGEKLPGLEALRGNELGSTI